MVEPTSVTSVSGPDASSAARTSSGSTPTGAQAKQSSRSLDGLVDRGRGAIDGATLDRGAQPLGVAAESHDLRVLDVLPRRQADRAADQPHAEDGYAHVVHTVRSMNCFPASSAAASSLRR